METGKLFRHRVASAIFGAISLATVAPATAAEGLPGASRFDGQWHFSLTPYAWLPTIYNSASLTGPFGISGGVDSAMHTTPNDYLDDLSFAFMIAGEARKGDWSVFTDYIYMKLKAQDTSVRTVRGPGGAVLPVADLGATMDLKSDVWTLAGSYTAWRRDASHLDVFAGTRYLYMNQTLDWSISGAAGLLPGRQRTLSASMNKWDVIAGVKGEVSLSDDDRVFMPYYLDIGSGSDNTTWQAMIALGYRYGWGDVTLALRNLSYDFTGRGEGIDTRFTGLALGATFHF